jgi:uncharacterized protein YjbI with pentapeptide repeats
VLHGAVLNGAELQGADLSGAELQGADLRYALLQGAQMRGAHLQGADMREAQMQGADLAAAFMHGASLRGANLQGAGIDAAELHAVSLTKAHVWRTWIYWTPPKIYSTDVDQLDETVKPWQQFWWVGTTFADFRDHIIRSISGDDYRTAASLSLSVLDPSVGPNEIKFAGRKIQLMSTELWTTESEIVQNDTTQSPAPPQGSDVRARRLATILVRLVCPEQPFELRLALPYIARGVIRNGRVAATGANVTIVADALRQGKANLAACPGVEGFTTKDWRNLDAAIAASSKQPVDSDIWQ